MNRVIEGVDGVRIGMHVCRGNWSRREEVLLGCAVQDGARGGRPPEPESLDFGEGVEVEVEDVGEDLVADEPFSPDGSSHHSWF